MKKIIGILLKTVLPLGLGVYLLWYFFTSMSDDSIEQFKFAMREANYGWLGISLIFGFIALISRAHRWKYVLEPMGYKTPLLNRYHSMMIGYLMNLTIPRAGEASRSAMLLRSDNVPFAKSFGTIVAERAVDLVCLGIISLLTFYLCGADFYTLWEQITTRFLGAPQADTGGFKWKYVIYAVLLLGIIAGTIFAIRNMAFRNKVRNFLKGLMDGGFAILKSTSPGGYIAHSILIWVCYICMFMFPMYALDETSIVPFRGVLMGFFAGTIGIMFTNGGIGAYPILVGIVISFYIQDEVGEKSEGIANAMGMLIWASQTFMMILLGLISLILIPKKYSPNDQASTNSSESNSGS